MAKAKSKTKVRKYIRTMIRKDVRKSDTLFWSEPIPAITVNQYIKSERVMKKWHIGGAFIALMVSALVLPFSLLGVTDLLIGIVIGDYNLLSSALELMFWGAISIITLYCLPLNATGIYWAVRNINKSQFKDL